MLAEPGDVTLWEMELGSLLAERKKGSRADLPPFFGRSSSPSLVRSKEYTEDCQNYRVIENMGGHARAITINEITEACGHELVVEIHGDMLVLA